MVLEPHLKPSFIFGIKKARLTLMNDEDRDQSNCDLNFYFTPKLYVGHIIWRLNLDYDKNSSKGLLWLASLHLDPVFEFIPTSWFHEAG